MFGINIDPPFVSWIQCFRNLVYLDVGDFCDQRSDNGKCSFTLNNDNITELAMVLTQLESLILGAPCSENTCLTTVACLLAISVHCNKLKKLMIHFNTTNIVDDFRNILEDPQFQQLRSLPRCPLTALGVYSIPLNLHAPGFDDYYTVVKGMADIFPSLTYCEEFGEIWIEVSREIVDLRENPW